MKTKSLSPIALFLTWVGLLVAYWPAGCSHAPGNEGVQSAAAPTLPGVVQTAAPRGAPAPSILPHPAFAFAEQVGDKQVTIADIAERATPSVVNIASKRVIHERGGQQDPFFRYFFGPMGPQGGDAPEQLQRGLGSGVIYSADGLVLTNNHVIEGADEITVTTSDGTDYGAKVVGTDAKSDVAVLRLEGKPTNLVPLPLGDSQGLRVGDVVLAIGDPFGFSQTVTMGIVSAKGRSETGIVDYADFIQTDAAINPGNSGGALVNMQGQLVGINTAIISRTGGYQGIGFAIPSNMAKTIAQSLIEHGKVVRGWLGIGIQDVSRELAAAMNLPNADGVVVSDVEPGSPAEKGGLLRGDVVLSVDGKKTNTSTRLRNIIAEAGSNKKVELALIRAGKPLTLSVTLGELKGEASETDKNAQAAPAQQQIEATDGLQLEPLDAKLRQRVGLPDNVKQGVVVTGIQPGSRAQQSGLAPGDVIIEVNKQPVASVQDYRNAYKKAGGKDAKGVLLLVYREGRTHYVVLGHH